MFWEVIAIMSLVLATIFGGIDLTIRILDSRDRNRSRLKDYLEEKNRQEAGKKNIR